jgi:hypothetical protein
LRNLQSDDLVSEVDDFEHVKIALEADAQATRDLSIAENAKRKREASAKEIVKEAMSVKNEDFNISSAAHRAMGSADAHATVDSKSKTRDVSKVAFDNSVRTRAISKEVPALGESSTKSMSTLKPAEAESAVDTGLLVQSRIESTVNNLETSAKVGVPDRGKSFF